MIKILNSVFMGHLHHQTWKQRKYCLMFILRAVLFLNIDNFHLIAIIYHLYLTRLLPKELSITLMFNGQSIKLFILTLISMASSLLLCKKCWRIFDIFWWTYLKPVYLTDMNLFYGVPSMLSFFPKIGIPLYYLSICLLYYYWSFFI